MKDAFHIIHAKLVSGESLQRVDFHEMKILVVPAEQSSVGDYETGSVRVCVRVYVCVYVCMYVCASVQCSICYFSVICEPILILFALYESTT